MKKKLSYMEEASQYYWQNFRKMMQARASRRVVIKAGTLAAIGGMGALSAVLEACNRRPTEQAKPDATVSTPGTPTGPAATEDPFKGLKMPSEIGRIGELPPGKYKWSRFPLVEYFNWRKLPWDTPPSRGGTIMRHGSPPAHWDLMLTETSTQFLYMTNGLLYPSMEPGENFDLQPIRNDLAEKIDHTPDYSSWTFTIPQGVKFHNIAPVNGRECTAEDVAYSMMRYKDTSLWGVSLEFVDKVTAADKYTVKFDMKLPIYYLPQILAMPFYQVFAKEHFEGDKELWKNQIIGTGPFVLTYSKYREKLESERNLNYWGKDKKGNQLPYADKIIGEYFADAATRKAAFRAGNLDEFHQEPMSVQDADDILKSNPNTFLAVNPQWSTGYHRRIMLQNSNKILADVRVRRALSMALDRRGIVRNALGGAGTPVATPVGYDQMGLKEIPNLEELGPYYQYNPTEAKKLLAEAGYPNGFSIKFTVPTGAVADDYLLVQKYWKDIGVMLTFDEQDYLVTTNRLIKKEHAEMFTPGAVIAFDPEQVLRPQFYTGAPQNWGNVADKTLDEILDKLRTSLDPDERTRLTRDANNRIMDQVYHIYIAGYHSNRHSQPWLHTVANSGYAQIGNWTAANYRWVSIDETAPNNRGGKKI